MHKKLSKPPLRYVLAQVKFTSIENVSEYISRLQDKVRASFPHYHEVNVQNIQLAAGDDSVKTSSLKQWHFVDKKKRFGIIVDKQAITIHANDYEQFTPLLERFKTVLLDFHEILNISLFTRLGLRYVNLIEGGSMSEVDAGLRGFHLIGDEFETSRFLTRIQTTQVTSEGTMNIQSTRVEDNEVVAAHTSFLPQELTEVAKVLSFDHQSQPGKAFMTLDFDHFSFSKEQNDFDIDTILERLRSLQEVIYKAFCQAVGENNLAAWSKELL